MFSPVIEFRLSWLMERVGGAPLTTYVLLLGQQRGGQGAFLMSAIFQLPSAKSNPYAKLAYLILFLGM